MVYVSHYYISHNIRKWDTFMRTQIRHVCCICKYFINQIKNLKILLIAVTPNIFCFQMSPFCIYFLFKFFICTDIIIIIIIIIVTVRECSIMLMYYLWFYHRYCHWLIVFFCIYVPFARIHLQYITGKWLMK